MMGMLGGMAALVVVVAGLMAWYFYGHLKRACLALRWPVMGWWRKVLLWITAAAIALLGCNIMHWSAIYILHAAAIGACVQLIYALFPKGRVWKWIYQSGLIPLLLAALVMAGGYWNLHHVVRTDYTVYTDKPIRAEGYRVALVADVHFGVSLDAAGVQKVCDDISALDVDVVALCGDIVDDGTTAQGMRDVFAALGSIRSELGIYYTYGNHDRLYARAGAFTREELVQVIRENGITILQDSVAQLTDDLVLVGREDLSASRLGSERASMAALLAGVDGQDFVLTLDHQPNEYAQNGRAGTDLLLSGHTHGGQIFPLGQVMALLHINDAVYGETQIDPDTTAIVTSGFAGWQYPIKTNAPAEYVIIDILPIQAQ